MGALSENRLLVGRSDELQTIESALAKIGRGEPAVLAIEGEAGIGKSRLVAELIDGARKHGFIELRGSAAEFEGDSPFGVVADALEAFSTALGMDEVREREPDLAKELALIFPGQRAAGAQAIAEERFRAHRAIANLLTLIAERRPTVVALDDLQWADAASLEAIAALVKRMPSSPVLLALSFRPTKVAEPLRAALITANADVLRPKPLSRDEAAALLTGVEEGQLDQIYEQSGGNPFYLEQISRLDPVALADSKRGRQFDVLSIPSALDAAIADELRRLGAEERRFLDAAAVAGEPFDIGEAAAIAEIAERDSLDLLDGLLALDILRPTETPRIFRFRHPLVRRAVYESTGVGWRVGAHERAAKALERAGMPPSRRAHHVERSAEPGDEDAVALLLSAGDSVAGRAPATAADWYESALRLLPSGDVEREVSVRIALADSLAAAGYLERCRDVLLRAAEMLPASARRAELTASCAAVEHWQGLHKEAHARLQRSWENLEERDGPEAATLRLEMAIDGLYENAFDELLATGASALELAQRRGDRTLIAAGSALLALGHAATGQTAVGRRFRDSATVAVESMDDVELSARLDTVFYLGWAETYLENYDAAIALAERGENVARAYGIGRLLVPLALMRCYPLEMQGRLAEAENLCSNAVETARVSGNSHFLSWALFELAWVHYFAGDLDSAIAAGEESVEISGRMTGVSIPSAGGGAGWALAVAHFERGDLPLARKLMDEVGDGGLMTGWVPVERCFNWENLALAEIASGNLSAARHAAARSGELASGTDLQLPKLLAARTNAAIALADGDAEAGISMAADAAAGAEQIGAELQAAFSNVLLGEALAATGERERAIQILRSAEQALDEFGSIRVRDQARRALRRLGARNEPRGRAAEADSGIGSLTKREREICELVAERMTNKQIAGKLFLSEKTVESHLRNVFFKLEVASRVEVARLIERDHAPADGP